MTLSLTKFLVLWFIYGLVSLVIFVFTSGGFTAVIGILPVVGGFYAITFILVLIISLILYKRDIKEVIISKKNLYFVLILQIITVLFNYGDCGDAAGGYAFIERLLIDVCRPETTSISSTFLWISLGLYLLLAIALLTSIGIVSWKAAKQNNAVKFVIARFFLYLTYIVSTFVIVAILLAGFVYIQTRLALGEPQIITGEKANSHPLNVCNGKQLSRTFLFKVRQRLERALSENSSWSIKVSSGCIRDFYFSIEERQKIAKAGSFRNHISITFEVSPSLLGGYGVAKILDIENITNR